MKQICSLLLGLSLVVGTAAAADRAPAKTDQPKGEKKGKSKSKTKNKNEKRKAEEPKAQ